MEMKLLEDTHGNISTIARIEAQMGGMFYLVGRYGEVRSSFESAMAKLHASGEKARKILELECGSCHLETIGVYSNLAATYDDIGSFPESVIAEVVYAIEILKYILKIREEKPGMENPNVDDEKIRLAAIRNRKGKSFENLLNANY
ncbi:hypothetical protein Golax_013955 [Gossypium laxum]|uniref:Uncharacterized protein n=1 Tax=Gossypium laxum TaxID=34288 RepID=A0A7J8ZTD5_9ROSI|nr:hypothetical protein [Gossypium laxum]